MFDRWKSPPKNRNDGRKSDIIDINGDGSSPPSVSHNDIVYSGYLYRPMLQVNNAQNTQTWKEIYTVLRKDNTMSYYEDEHNMVKPMHVIQIQNVDIRVCYTIFANQKR
jgi:hypothetical protein